MMKLNQTEKFYSHRQSFSIIGLTGRTGAGVSKVADFLSKEFKEIESIQPLKIGELNNKMRRYNISFKFSKENWKTYKIINYKVLFFFTSLEGQQLNSYYILATKVIPGTT